VIRTGSEAEGKKIFASVTSRISKGEFIDHVKKGGSERSFKCKGLA